MTPVFEVLLTKGAEADLKALWEYITSKRSAAEATAMLDTILDRIDTLEQFPDRGSIPEELASLGTHEFRQIIQPPYRLIYRVIDKKVIISVIVDARRDLKALLERRFFSP